MSKNIHTSTRPALRVGCVPYLNARPLIYDFKTVWPEANLYLAVPIDLAGMLDAGLLDLALLSSIHQQKGYQPIGQIGIVSDGPVKSVLLHSRVPLEEIEKVALLQDSLTSSAMTKIILEGFYGRRPEYRSYHLPLEQGLFMGDAALTVGDPAHLFEHHTRFIFDLGEEWRRKIGLPFVYARWLGGDHVDTEAVSSILDEMKRRGCSHIEDIVRDSSDSNSLTPDFVREYLTQCIRYDIGPRESKGLEEFLHLYDIVARRRDGHSPETEASA